MRLIDADVMISDTLQEYENSNQYRNAIIRMINKAPTIDAVKVVRCQDCKHWVYNFNGCRRNPCTEPWYATDFCNYGEREGE